MTRIKGAKILYGESIVLPIERNEDEKIDSPAKLKLKEELLLVENEIEQAKVKRDEIIADGQRQAEVLIEKARADMEKEHQEVLMRREEEQKQLEADEMRIKEKAYDTGYENGYKQGFQTITHELEEKIIAVDTFAKSQFKLKTNIIKSSELDIIKLVLEISQKICTKSLELNPDLIRVITLNAIRALKDKEEIKIIVNPKLTDIINTVSEKLKETIPQLNTIRIIEENNVSADGTIVESLLTRVDSRVKAQIDEIADRLMESYNSTDYEEYIPVEEHPLIEDYKEIELSGEANIAEFLSELEEIHLIEDKVRDEDAEYYEKINLNELQDDKLNSQTSQSLIEDVNMDELEDVERENFEQDESFLKEAEEFLSENGSVENEIKNLVLPEVEKITEENNSVENENEKFDLPKLETVTGNEIFKNTEEEGFKELDLSEIKNVTDVEIPNLEEPLNIDVPKFENIDLAEEKDV